MAADEKSPGYDLRESSVAEVKHLFFAHHGYKSIGGFASYVFAVFEDGKPVAAFLWNPPPPGAAKSVCPECPQGVLSLSRMVAVPKDQRRLKHISKPLRRQMLHMIDRTRWPVLVTYSDEGQGHNGFVYQCSGWEKTTRNKVPTLTMNGQRVSTYFGGKTRAKRSKEEGQEHLTAGAVKSHTYIQRWEHKVPNPAMAFDLHWERYPIPGKVWASGSQAYAFRKRSTPQAQSDASSGPKERTQK